MSFDKTSSSDDWSGVSVSPAFAGEPCATRVVAVVVVLVLAGRLWGEAVSKFGGWDVGW